MKKQPSAFTVRYGFRAIVPVAIISFFTVFLFAEYLYTGRGDSTLLALTILFLIIDLILVGGFRITISSWITKKYYHPETMVGETGRVIKGASAGETGTVTVASEDWSFVCDSDTYDNEIVTVVQVMPDNVILKVRKIS